MITKRLQRVSISHFLMVLGLLMMTSCSIKSLSKRGEVVSEKDSYAVPMSYEKKLVYVNVTINGKPYRFIMDTGATTLIDDSIFENGEFKVVGHVGVKDSNGNSNKLKIVRLDNFKVGALEIENSVALVADLSTLKCYNIDGLIGSNTLALLDVEVDYESEQLMFYRTPPAQNMLDTFDIALDFTETDQRIPKLALQWDNWIRDDMTLDMGSTNTLSMKSSKNLNPHNFKNATWFFGKTSLGLYGSASDTTHYFQFDSMEIAEYSFDSINVNTRSNSSNLIGNDFWDEYHMLISWDRKKVYLKQNNTKRETALPSGVVKFFTQDAHLIIAGLYEKSRLHAEGVEYGNKILSVNGVPTNNMTDEVFCTWKESIEGGETYLFEIQTNTGIKSIEISGAEIKAK